MYSIETYFTKESFPVVQESNTASEVDGVKIPSFVIPL